MVLRGFTTIWSLATLPTRSSPFSETATTLGRMSAPLSLGTTFAILLRTYATHVFVVPRSIPSRMGFSAISGGSRSWPDATVRGRGGARKARTAATLPPHPVANARTCGGGLRHLGGTHLATHAAQLEDELQRALQDVVGRLGRVRAVEARHDQPRPGRVRRVREGDPPGDQSEKAIQVLEHHRGGLPEQQEGHAEDRPDHGGAQVLRADAFQHLGLPAALVDEVDDVAEEGADALPGRLARAGRGGGGLHAATLARASGRL